MFPGVSHFSLFLLLRYSFSFALHTDVSYKGGQCQPNRNEKMHPDVIRKFLDKVSVADGDCWEHSGQGYSSFGHPMLGRHRFNRAAWLIFRGPIPPDTWVLHKCDNKKCGNPFHLFLGSPSGNTQDMIAKGRAGWQQQELFTRERWQHSHTLPSGIKRCAVELLEDLMWDYDIAPSRVGRDVMGSPNFLSDLVLPGKTVLSQTIDKIHQYVLAVRGLDRLEVEIYPGMKTMVRKG